MQITQAFRVYKVAPWNALQKKEKKKKKRNHCQKFQLLWNTYVEIHLKDLLLSIQIECHQKKIEYCYHGDNQDQICIAKNKFQTWKLFHHMESVDKQCIENEEEEKEKKEEKGGQPLTFSRMFC